MRPAAQTQSAGSDIPAALAYAVTVMPDKEQIPSPVVPYVQANPVSVLLNEKLRERFLAEIKDEVEAFVPDLTTKKSRQEIASLAYKVSLTKAPIEKAAKALNEDLKRRVDAVNDEKTEILKALDSLRDLARSPLNEWEEAEKARQEALKATFTLIDESVRVLADDTSATVKDRIAAIEAIEDNDDFHEARERALSTLQAAHERLLKDEADRAELARLRALEAERQQQEQERIAAEAEKQIAEQREREEVARKLREEKEVQERIETAKQQAAEEAIAAEQRRAAQLALEEKRKANAEIARLAAEKLKLEHAEAARIAEEKRLASEELARQKDRKHRSEIMTVAKEALMKAGTIGKAELCEASARKIVMAIVAGEIPNVTLKF